MEELSIARFIIWLEKEYFFKPGEIKENSFIEDDIGITGDDGSELLEALEKKYNIKFEDENRSLREIFGLEHDEYLFHSEGMPSIFELIKRIFGFSSREKVKPMTVRQLYDIIVFLKYISSDTNLLKYHNLSQHKKLIHFTTTIKGGVSEGNYTSFNFGISSGDDIEKVNKNKEILSTQLGVEEDKIFIPRLTHSDQIASIDENFLLSAKEKQAELLQGVDALVTQQKGICIAITTADCVPVLVYDPVNHVLGAIHAGWRGTVNKIVSKTISKMIHEYGSKPEDLVASIGPSICQDCFEVGNEVVEAFTDAGFLIEKIGNKDIQTQKYHLDLWKSNQLLMEQSGILSKNIEVCGLCTFNNPSLFFSARRQTIKSGRMLTGGVLQ